MEVYVEFKNKKQKDQAIAMFCGTLGAIWAHPKNKKEVWFKPDDKEALYQLIGWLEGEDVEYQNV